MATDKAKVMQFVKDRVQKDVKANGAQKQRHRADLQGLQFYRGGEDNTWTVWDPTAQTYVPRPRGTSDDAALPDWFFRSNSNLFATKIDGICSLLNQSQPAQEISPQRDQDGDRAAAEIAEAALPVLLEEAGYPASRSQLHKLIALTNAALVHVYYDNDERHGLDDLPILQCASCGDYFMPHEVPDESMPCPSCGAETAPADPANPTATPGPATQMAMNPQQPGLPMTVQQPRGKLCMQTLTSFEFSYPRSAKVLDEEQMAWIAGHGRMDVNDILAMWPDAEGHLDEQASRHRTSGNVAIAYADQMRSMAAPGNEQDKGLQAGGSSVSPSGPVVWFVWADPVDDKDFHFPDGLYAALLEDDIVLESGPLPFTDDQGRPKKNVLIRTFQASPGAAWGKPPGDDLVSLQKQLNLCQALAFLILMNDAAPTTYIPDTVTLLDDLSGMPGATVQFKSLRAGDKPIIAQGSGFPESLQWFIEYLVNQFDVVSKLNAVLMGERPAGDPTLGEVQTLVERGMAAFKEPLDGLVQFEKRLSYLCLMIARQSMWSPRFYQVAGENGDHEVKQFLGADLEGGIVINVEPSSAWPASQLLLNLRLDQAIERQIIDPHDPEVQATYLSQNDLTRYKKSMDLDARQVARQLDIWKAAQDPAEIVQPDPLWNLPFHFFKKVSFLKTEEAEQMATERPLVYQAIREHVMAIQMLMMPPPTAGPAGQPGVSAAGKPGVTAPDGSAVDAAVKGGAMRPGRTGPPTGDAVTAAVKGGAMRPRAPMPAGVQ